MYQTTITMTKQQQVYLLKDNNRNLHKIGRRSVGNPRFLRGSSFLKNDYGCDIKQVSVSKGMNKDEVRVLENTLQKLYEDKQVDYPPVTLSETLEDGSVITWTKNRSGYTEWFNLSVDEVSEVVDILSHS